MQHDVIVNCCISRDGVVDVCYPSSIHIFHATCVGSMQVMRVSLTRGADVICMFTAAAIQLLLVPMRKVGFGRFVRPVCLL